MLAATYVLPLKAGAADGVGELASYLRWLVGTVDHVVVVDGSPRPVFEAHAAAFPPEVAHLPPATKTPMGKVGGVLTGIDLARHDRLVIADDDVRYDEAALTRVVELLDEAEVVRPANAFDPLPWHARLDTGRILLNRAFGGDWPGTLAVRRSALAHAGGYRGDVLFENLELVRTVEAGGGRERLASEVIVRRLPPRSAHFLGQRVRQAYDEWARPWRLLAFLAVAPTVAVLVARRRGDVVAGLAALTVAAAEAGRWRAGGRRAFPVSSSLLAPLWVAERAVCSWLAVGARLRGGARYGDGRLRTAASSPRELAGAPPQRRPWWVAAGAAALLTLAVTGCSDAEGDGAGSTDDQPAEVGGDGAGGSGGAPNESGGRGLGSG